LLFVYFALFLSLHFFSFVLLRFLFSTHMKSTVSLQCE
jgi:hypothetical protein